MPAEDDEMRRQVVWDRHMGLLSLAMWGGTAVKVAPHISRAENVQAWVGMVIIFLIAVAWPTLGYRSYVRWRVAGVSALRIALFALPFNFSLAVFDAIAPEINRGRLAVVSNVFQLFMSIRIALLSFTSMGWRVPFRLHMLLQAVNIWILVRFGMHVYCRSKLLSSPEVAAIAGAVHSTMAFIAMVFVPSTGVIVPSGAYPQLVAALLFCWVVLGWLMPTLLLLPEVVAAEARSASASGGSGGGSQGGSSSRRLATWLANGSGRLLETWLRMLLPSSGTRELDWAQQRAQAQAEQQALQLPSLASCTLHWWAVLLVTWGLCCTVAPFLTPPGPGPTA